MPLNKQIKSSLFLSQHFPTLSLSLSLSLSQYIYIYIYTHVCVFSSLLNISCINVCVRHFYKTPSVVNFFSHFQLASPFQLFLVFDWRCENPVISFRHSSGDIWHIRFLLAFQCAQQTPASCVSCRQVCENLFEPPTTATGKALLLLSLLT